MCPCRLHPSRCANVDAQFGLEVLLAQGAQLGLEHCADELPEGRLRQCGALTSLVTGVEVRLP